MPVIKNISKRILISILTGTIIIFSLYGLANYIYIRNKITDLTEIIVEKTFRSAYNQLEAQIKPIFTYAGNTSYHLNHFSLNHPEILSEFQETFKNFPYMYGTGISYLNEKDSTYLNIYQLNEPGSIMQISNSPADTIRCCNFKYDIVIFNDTLSLRYYFISTGEKEGYLIYDFPLNLFTNLLNKETRQLQSTHFLFNCANDTIIHIKHFRTQDNSSGDNKAVKIAESFIAQNKYGFFTYPDFYKNNALYISKIRDTDLILASTMRTDGVIRQFRTFFNITFLITILTVVLLIYFLQKIIIKATKPIAELSALSRKIEKGSLHTEIPDTFTDSETIQLSKTLRIVQGRMQRYVSDLNSTLKVKRALEQELNIAEKIQLDMLPKADRALTEQPEIDVYSIIQPAKGVAGDFYDYFFIDKYRLFFVLGDVSGKGIPAALFMVKTITLIQIEARKGKSPGEVFELINNQLIFRNEEGMFVTAISGIIDIKTGNIVLCDAGHNTPLSALNSKDFSYKLLNKNMPLGVLENTKYKETSFDLNSEDSIVLYSDGLPEANSKSGNMLDYEAIENELKGCGHKDIQIIANTIMDLYDRFTYNADANDDVTVFIIRFFGDKKH